MTTENTDTKQMVERVDWMSPIHYEILRFYESHDIWATPVVVSRNIGYQRSYTGKEMRRLTAAQLLENEDGTGMYSLTDFGRRFLAGGVDPDQISEPD